MYSMQQFAIQVTNNVYLKQWTIIAIFSTSLSIYFALDVGVKFLFYRYISRVHLKDIPTSGFKNPFTGKDLFTRLPAKKRMVRKYSDLGEGDPTWTIFLRAVDKCFPSWRVLETRYPAHSESFSKEPQSGKLEGSIDSAGMDVDNIELGELYGENVGEGIVVCVFTLLHLHYYMRKMRTISA